MTCKDCIHEKVCDNLIAHGLPWEDGKYPAEKWCDHFKNKADVVEVVRCKDCKWWTKEKIGSQGRCGMLGHYPRDVFYCSHGERKEK